MTGAGQVSDAVLFEGQELDEPARAPAFKKGEVLVERYLIEGLIARGGMGEVYDARHVQLGKRVAIKTLLATATSEAARRRFEREARVLASLENEHIVSAFDFGTAPNGRVFLVMEYLDGVSLRSLLRAEGPLVAPRAVRLATQLCRGLSAAHSVGAVHRDLKPENIVISRRADGSEGCKILDFGLVKISDPGPGLHTRTGVALGTVSYMSPEQARGGGNVDHRSDLYSLGVILYELLSGKRPHDAGSALALVQLIINDCPRHLSEICDVPSGLNGAVMRALSIPPSERYGSAEEFAAALAPYLASALGPERRETTVALTPPTSSFKSGRTGRSWKDVVLTGTAVGIAATLLRSHDVSPPSSRALGNGASSHTMLQVSPPAPESLSHAGAPHGGAPRTSGESPTATSAGPPRLPKARDARPSAPRSKRLVQVPAPNDPPLREDMTFDRDNPYDGAR